MTMGAIRELAARALIRLVPSVLAEAVRIDGDRRERELHEALGMVRCEPMPMERYLQEVCGWGPPQC
jgi:hypothetical protein